MGLPQEWQVRADYKNEFNSHKVYLKSNKNMFQFRWTNAANFFVDLLPIGLYTYRLKECINSDYQAMKTLEI